MKTCESIPAIDTSRMNTGQREAIELTEAAREAGRDGFLASLFMGHAEMPAMFPFPQQAAADRARGDEFLEKLAALLCDKVDADEIDQTGEIPEEVIEALRRLGAFGIKVPREYGGLGLSQTNYCRAAMLLGGWCGNLTALLSAHQSIGVPQPLLLFGTDEQKRKFLPRVARGEISAFALTERGAGSDPAKMQTHAEPTEDGRAFLLNGEKLWCTNGTRAGVTVVMAKTPAKFVNGVEKNQITAFIVEMDTPGIDVVHRCRFMGLRALYNGVIQFTNVRVPRENILLGEGKGLRVALTTLNTGRLTLPAACVGMSKRCLDIAKRWASEREQWGAPIGKHAAIAEKLGRMAANTFAMEAMTLYAASLVDRDKHADVRLEAAACKLWGTEAAWNIVNDTMQIRGGRGYETAQSLSARDEEAEPVERFFRDSRINTIFEGSSEIMRLFMAREALDPHLKVAGAMFNWQLPIRARVSTLLKAVWFYARWYPALFVPRRLKVQCSKLKAGRALKRHLRFVECHSRKLARSLFHEMLRHGPKLEREQLVLGRLVDVGCELFAMSAACARAAAMGDPAAIALASAFCAEARVRVDALLALQRNNAEAETRMVAKAVLTSDFNNILGVTITAGKPVARAVEHPEQQAA